MSNDEVLEYLVREVEETGVGTAISLYMNGLIVAGTTMCSKRYCDLMSALRSEQFQTTGPKEIAIEKHRLDENEKYFWDRIKKTSEKIEYIHLDMATVYSPDLLPTYVAVNPWRGKISSIDAWSIGIVTPFKKPRRS